MPKKDTKTTAPATKEVKPAPEKKEEKKADKKKEVKKDDKKKVDAKKEEKKVDVKKEEKKAEKKAKETKDEKKVEAKKETKPTAAPKDKKTAPKKKVEKKDEKKKKPISEKVAIRELMRKDPKMRKEIAKGTKGLSKQRAHAKRLKLMRKNRFIKFVVDCHKLFKDKILKPRSLERYFKSHIKVDGKTHNFGRKIKTKLHSHRVVVLARPPFAKRYLKYLTRRYLKKNLMRDHVRIVSHGQNGYRLGYYKITMDDANEGSE